MRKILLFTLLVVTLQLSAQDLIVTQSGETIKAYRTDVGEKMVYYQLEDAEDAPILKIQKADVLVIKLQNGKVVFSQDATPQQQDNRQSTSIMPPKEPVADPEVIASAQIGSLIEFYDGTKGIVFYLDGNGHGLAVYLYEDYELMCWQEASSWNECVDINAIPNEENKKIQMGLGTVYCDAARKQLGLGNLPAIKWCQSIGPDWYLPSLGELYELLAVANKSKGSKGPISHAIVANGGNPFSYKSTVYYSSSEDDNTKVYSVFSSGAVKNAKKYTPHACRAIRMF